MTAGRALRPVNRPNPLSGLTSFTYGPASAMSTSAAITHQGDLDLGGDRPLRPCRRRPRRDGRKDVGVVALRQERATGLLLQLLQPGGLSRGIFAALPEGKSTVRVEFTPEERAAAACGSGAVREWTADGEGSVEKTVPVGYSGEDPMSAPTTSPGHPGLRVPFAFGGTIAASPCPGEIAARRSTCELKQRTLASAFEIGTMNRIVLAAFTTLCTAASAQAQILSAEDLARRTVERRAVEAVIWGVPAVNYDLMYQQMLRLGGKPNQIVYWSGLLDWRNQTLTPNPDVIYLMAFFNTKDGPMVIEIPPAGDGVINGSIMDPWQAALEDVGRPGQPGAQACRYLILPPGYQGAVPDGYIALPSANYQGYALLRSILKSGSEADVQAAVAYGRRIKLYLIQTAHPPETVFLDAKDAVYDATIPYDLRFFQSLDRFVQQEPWLTRDKAMIDPLKSLGIERASRSIRTRQRAIF